MNGLLIATHDQALHAIRAHVNQPGTDQLLRGVVLAVLDVHQSYSSPWRPGSNPDCESCEGRGWFPTEEVDREHCHCRCPWCAGCDEPLCLGACPSVAAIAGRLDLVEMPAPMACGAFQQGQAAGLAPYRCSEPAGHAGAHRAVIDGLAVADWPPVTP